MKKHDSIFLLFLVVSLVAEKLILANGEWKPYLSQDLKHYGFASHVVTEAFSNAGIDVEYKWYGLSWKRALKDAQRNIIDGTLVWSHKDEREVYMFYSQEPVLYGKTDLIYHLKTKEIKWENISDLSKYTFGGVLGYTYGKEIDATIDAGVIKIQRVKTDEQNFRKLLFGRIDCFIAGKKVGEEILRSKFSPYDQDRIISNKKPTRVVTYHLLLNRMNPKNESIMKRFDKSLAEMKKEGVYQKYLLDFENGKYKKDK